MEQNGIGWVSAVGERKNGGKRVFWEKMGRVGFLLILV